LTADNSVFQCSNANDVRVTQDLNSFDFKLRDQFEQTWLSLIDDSPKVNNYKLFKTSFQKEDYFELLEHKKPLISADLEPQIISYQ
jgi:hypothetical protein